MNDDRKDFLVNVYNQMFNDINRHIMVVWQSVGVLIGAFAIFALVEKSVMPLDIAVAIIVLLSAWLVSHLLDASYWYNRNLVIVANIERQFLTQGDLREIHYYFGAHRPKNRMIEHLKIQLSLGVGLVILVLGYHFSERVLPTWCWCCWDRFDFVRTLPYMMLAVSIAYLCKLKRGRDSAYQEFLKNSPGHPIDSTNVSYGPGHGHDAL